jgi:hypothetical protein
VHGGLRAAVSAEDVPYHLAKFMYEGFNYKTTATGELCIRAIEMEGFSIYGNWMEHLRRCDQGKQQYQFRQGARNYREPAAWHQQHVPAGKK